MVLRTEIQTSVPLAAVMVYLSAVKGARALSTLLASTLPSTVRQQAYGTVISAPKIGICSHRRSLDYIKRYSANQISKTQFPTVFLNHSGITLTESRLAKMASTRRLALSRQKPHSKQFSPRLDARSRRWTDEMQNTWWLRGTT